jgi:hypothetical protein
MVADRMVFLDQGKVLQQGAPKSLREDPQHLEVARWMSRMSSLFFQLPPGDDRCSRELPEWSLSLRIAESYSTSTDGLPLDLIVPLEAWAPLRGIPDGAEQSGVSIWMKPMERRWVDSRPWRRWETPGGQSCWRIELEEDDHVAGESVACCLDWKRLLWFQPNGERLRCEVVAGWRDGRGAAN